VDIVLAKGATPSAGKWNNTDSKIVIQWYKQDGDNAMPNKMEGFLHRYQETHTHAVEDCTYHHAHMEGDVTDGVAAATSALADATIITV
jgi:hypothetical protein